MSFDYTTTVEITESLWERNQKTNTQQLQQVIDKMAPHFENSELLAATNPVTFLEKAVTKLDELSKDEARLDFLDQITTRPEHGILGKLIDNRWELQESPLPGASHTVREAIDKFMARYEAYVQQQSFIRGQERG